MHHFLYLVKLHKPKMQRRKKKKCVTVDLSLYAGNSDQIHKIKTISCIKKKVQRFNSYQLNLLYISVYFYYCVTCAFEHIIFLFFILCHMQCTLT